MSMDHIRPTAAKEFLYGMSPHWKQLLLRLAIALFCNAQNSIFPVNLSY